ncbi:hypothetical protein [Cellulomonas marina]|uniref:D-mannose binding lectin n=1 Tax=Cellulomonas marina TaxID=988821 RepID=A0A1I0ZPC8_9CELL|nr:hypothetical protein [Cellulomonas marina]GIG28892.1 hypothetical protein Cma02nite_14920 [Cellulomonas marina]SFB26976.1 D-mannose binding lectin [Cellulomonas marina]
MLTSSRGAARPPRRARAALLVAVALALVVPLGAARPAAAADRGSSLLVGQELLVGDRLLGHGTELVLQGDGNLVLYVSGTAAWHAGTAGTDADRFAVQTDGNAVLYDRAGRPLWQSGTRGEGVRLEVGTGPGLDLYAGDGRLLWTVRRPTVPAEIGLDTRVTQMLSPNGAVRLSVDTGDWSVRALGATVWHTQTRGGDVTLVLQGDGNLVAYHPSGRPLWQSGTAGRGVVRLVLQDDTNLVLYTAEGRAAWSSSWSPRMPGDCLSFGNALCTGQVLLPGDELRTGLPDDPAPHRLVLQRDGNLVRYAPDGRATWSSGTVGSVAVELGLRRDGEAELRRADGSVVWTSRTAADMSRAPWSWLVTPYVGIAADGSLWVDRFSGRATFA